jgi:DNA polymerase-3 subunit beta
MNSNQFEITNPARVLATPIKTALQAASSKSSIPVLEGILFELTGEGLVLVGSDLEQWIIVKVPEVKLPLGLTNDPIKFVLPKKVAEAILRLPDGLAMFEFLPERVALKIKYGYNQQNSQTHQLYRADDFIQVPDVQGEEFAFNSSVGVDLKRVLFAVAAPNEPRAVFTGVNINFEACKIAASDTARVAVMDIPGEANGGIRIPDETVKIAPRINIPARMVKAIDSMDEIVLTVDRGHVKAVSNDKTTTIISRLIPGEYPKLSPIVDSAVNSKIFKVEFSAREMIGTLNRVGLMISGNQMPKFIFGPKYISVSAQSESNMVSEDVPCEVVYQNSSEDINLTAHFNHKYIMDALKHAESEKVTWGLTGQYTPSVIRAAGDDRDKGKGDKGDKGEDGWLCIIVPGRVAGE